MHTNFQFQRYVPFAAVAAANCVNIPLMRQNEITQGIEVSDENGNKVTKSKVELIMQIRDQFNYKLSVGNTYCKLLLSDYRKKRSGNQIDLEVPI